MAFGFAIRQPSGRLWMSPDVTPMNLIERLTIIACKDVTFTTSVPSTVPIMIFVRYAKKIYTWQEGKKVLTGFDFQKQSLSGYHAYRLWGGFNQSSPITVYVFAAMAKKSSKYGLDIYNATGTLVYSAQMRPLQMAYYSTQHALEFTTDLKEPVAVVPMEYSTLLSDPVEYYYTAACGTQIYTVLGANFEVMVAGGGDLMVSGELASSGFFYIKTVIYDK